MTPSSAKRNSTRRSPLQPSSHRDLVARGLAVGADPLPGARELVSTLRGHVPIAVASNSPRAFVDVALGSAGLADLFEFVYAAERPKPAPDFYLAAYTGLGADPALSVAFEDSRIGVASARAAGMYVIGVPSLPHTRLASSGRCPGPPSEIRRRYG